MSTIKIPPVLRGSVGGDKEVEASGGNVGEVLRALASQHPATESQLFSEDGELNRYVNVYLNDEDVRVLEGLDTSVVGQRHDRDPAGHGRRQPLIVRLAERRDEPAWARMWDESARAAFTELLPAGARVPRGGPRALARAARRPGRLHADGRGRTASCSGSRPAARAATRMRATASARCAACSWPPAAGAQGVGRALMAAALDSLRERGCIEATRLVLRGQRARERFYETRGFTRDGAEQTEEVWADLPEVRYRRSL